ncbi:MAG: DNA translocase FtsK [Planctomycetota bacterium]|nr:DNA translocase FtsK [Planctomycetota bacterium]
MKNKKMSKSGSATPLMREIAAFLAMAAASFLLLSLWTYHAADLPEIAYPNGEGAMNRGGIFGARLAQHLFMWLGVFAPTFLAFFLLVAGGRAFMGRSLTGLWYRAPSAGLFLLSVSVTEAMLRTSGALGDGFLRGDLAGGIYGVHLAGLVQPALGGLPSLLIVGTIGGLSLTTTTGGVPASVRSMATLGGRLARRSLRRPKFLQRVATEKAKDPIPQIEPLTIIPTLEETPVELEEVTVRRPSEKRPRPSAPPIEEEPADDASEPEPPVITVTSAPAPESESLPMAEPTEVGEFVLPQLSLLEQPEEIEVAPESELREQAETLRRTLSSFKVEVRVSEIQRGPAITLYELELAPGTKVTKIVSLADDLAMALKAQGIRVVYPIPNKSTVGIEVPNQTQEVVRLRELIESDAYRKRKYGIPLLIGKNTQGEPMIRDLAKMPHLLIAGQTGSGKSVCLNSIILSLLFTRTPSEVRMILIDPKQVELMSYESLPHLLTPVVTDMKKAAGVLTWVVAEMERRYERLAKIGVRHINSYNALQSEELLERLPPEMKDKGLEHPMPFIVVVVDELGDLMMTASREVEESIIRLAQKSRAVGIHVVLATQRPSADVLTGLIKSNLPCRIAFQVAGRVDSRTILDRNGAEKLQGSGDLLFQSPGDANFIRCQGTYVSDAEIRRAVSTIRRAGSPTFDSDLQDWDPETSLEDEDLQSDDRFDQAVQIILETGRGSASLLQRRLEIGYTRASRLIDMMEKRGVVGAYKGSKAREILISLEEWEGMKSSPSGHDS